MAPIQPSEVVEPIEDFETLISFQSNKLKNISPVSLSSKKFSNFKIKIDGSISSISECPKVMVCHDFKGGYGDDKYINGTNNPENYTFRHWLQTDIFVYFAHKFITIPPLGWINCSHIHGTKILGTIITEWTDGYEICKKMLIDHKTIDLIVQKLCDINDHYGFDGYLINIENKIDPEQISNLTYFVKMLSEKLKERDRKNLVYWYDSVIESGQLLWQDELNEKNRIFFDVCDGIYLNYNWTDEKMENSLKIAGERKFDIFVGIDCFGRNCYGGGGLNMFKAVEKIASHNMSMAIFAPGWSFECHNICQYPCIDDKMWGVSLKYFYFRTLTNSKTHCENNSSPNILFQTDFSRGYGNNLFSFGKLVNSDKWFNLSNQSFQPLIMTKFFKEKNSVCESSQLSYHLKDACFGSGCLKLLNLPKSNEDETNEDEMDQIQDNKIWIPVQIDNNGEFAVVFAWKSEYKSNSAFEIYLNFSNGNRRALSTINNDNQIKNPLHKIVSFSDFIRDKESEQIKFKFKFISGSNYNEIEYNGWKISCCIFNEKLTESNLINGISFIFLKDLSLGYFALASLE